MVEDVQDYEIETLMIFSAGYYGQNLGIKQLEMVLEVMDEDRDM